MSVLVKGMSIPDNCELCAFETECGFCLAKPDNFCGDTNDRKRPEWCPLVEVPEPHGRLIDENEVRIVMNWLLTQPQRPTWNDTYRAIQEMYAVIEAEGE